MINRVTLLGRLGKDPEVRTTQGGSKVAMLSVATDRSVKSPNGEWQSITEWHRVVGWENQAAAAERCHKGDEVYVEGRIQSRKYQDQQGVERTVCEIIATTIKGLGRREKQQQAQQTQYYNDPAVEQQRSENAARARANQAAGNYQTGDVPF